MKQNCYLLPEKEESNLEFEEFSVTDSEERELKVRLDKWLWAARFFKTRALARNAIEHGKILYNNEKVKPTIEIALEAQVNIRQGRFSKIVIIKGLSTRRKNATDALNLFIELPAEEYQALEADPYNTHNVGEYTMVKPKKVVRFLRRACVRNHNHSNHEN